MGTLTIVCPWCKPARTLGTKPTDGPDDTTHSICANCLKEQEQELEKMKADSVIRNHLQDDPAACWNRPEGEP